MQSNKYWEDRANQRMADYHKNNDLTTVKINNAYDKAISDINHDIKRIFDTYTIGSKLDSSEIRKLLNSKISVKEIEDIRAKIDFINDEEIKNYLKARFNSNAYKARITRLEALKNSIYIRSKQIADTELTESNLGYINTIKDAYYKNIYDIQKGIGIGFDFASMPVSKIDEILSNKWSGENYSQRIWGNTDVLAGKLEETITSGLMSGKSMAKIAKELVDMTNYGKMAAERLVRTETTYVANMAELQSYKECDIKKYVFVATLDMRTSQICREHDGKIYEVSKGVSGENLPPLHPWCRSTTIAYMGAEWFKGIQRRARDPQTGKTYVIQNMNYNEWYQKYVVDKYGDQKAESFEKIIKNKASDKKQFAEYKKILGKESPKSLKEFQDLKYNSIKEWEVKKREYSTIEAISNKEWSNVYKEKVKGAYYDFRKDNVELSWHGAQRFVDRNKDKSGNVIFTQKDIVSIFNNKPNYSQEDGRLVNFQNGIAIIRNNKTNEIVSIVNRKNPKKEWI